MKAVLREIVRRRVGPDVAYRKKQGLPSCGALARSKWSAGLKELKGETLLAREGWMSRRHWSVRCR